MDDRKLIDAEELLNQIKKIDPFWISAVSMKWQIIKIIEQMAEESKIKPNNIVYGSKPIKGPCFDCSEKEHCGGILCKEAIEFWEGEIL